MCPSRCQSTWTVGWSGYYFLFFWHLMDQGIQSSGAVVDVAGPVTDSGQKVGPFVDLMDQMRFLLKKIDCFPIDFSHPFNRSGGADKLPDSAWIRGHSVSRPIHLRTPSLPLSSWSSSSLSLSLTHTHILSLSPSMFSLLYIYLSIFI